MSGFQTSTQRIKEPAKKLARILNDEFGTEIKPYEVAQLISSSWTELSLYAHALHDQQERTK